MIDAAAPLSVTLYRDPLAQPEAGNWWSTIISRLLGQGIFVKVINSLEALKAANSDCSKKNVVLGQFNGAVPCDVQALLHDVTGKTPDEVVSLVQQSADRPAGAARHWKPWFPVIDFNRCTNCMQCLSFCLFDVYGVTTDGKIKVQNESNCKTDCPACSRVCPEVAIMFPKYKVGPINGDQVNSEDVRREAMKVDISALLGGDIYSMLRDRSAKAKSRFSKERDDDRALRERQRCLEKLKDSIGDFEIPAEVLASLPTPDQIQFKAEQARKRAADALERQAAAQSANNEPTPPASAQAGSN